MYDHFIRIVIGLGLVCASLFAKGFSYGMAPHRQKPRYPATRRLRFILFSFGLLFFGLGLIGALHT